MAALKSLMGTQGTLCMPTHPFYPYAKWGLGLADDKDDVIPAFVQFLRQPAAAPWHALELEPFL